MVFKRLIKILTCLTLGTAVFSLEKTDIKFSSSIPGAENYGFISKVKAPESYTLPDLKSQVHVYPGNKACSNDRYSRPVIKIPLYAKLIGNIFQRIFNIWINIIIWFNIKLTVIDNMIDEWSKNRDKDFWLHSIVNFLFKPFRFLCQVGIWITEFFICDTFAVKLVSEDHNKPEDVLKEKLLCAHPNNAFIYWVRIITSKSTMNSLSEKINASAKSQNIGTQKIGEFHDFAMRKLVLDLCSNGEAGLCSENESAKVFQSWLQAENRPLVEFINGMINSLNLRLSPDGYKFGLDNQNISKEKLLGRLTELFFSYGAEDAKAFYNSIRELSREARRDDGYLNTVIEIIYDQTCKFLNHECPQQEASVLAEHIVNAIMGLAEPVTQQAVRQKCEGFLEYDATNNRPIRFKDGGFRKFLDFMKDPAYNPVSRVINSVNDAATSLIDTVKPEFEAMCEEIGRITDNDGTIGPRLPAGVTAIRTINSVMRQGQAAINAAGDISTELARVRNNPANALTRGVISLASTDSNSVQRLPDMIQNGFDQTINAICLGLAPGQRVQQDDVYTWDNNNGTQEFLKGNPFSIILEDQNGTITIPGQTLCAIISTLGLIMAYYNWTNSRMITDGLVVLINHNCAVDTLTTQNKKQMIQLGLMAIMTLLTQIIIERDNAQILLFVASILRLLWVYRNEVMGHIEQAQTFFRSIDYEGHTESLVKFGKSLLLDDVEQGPQSGTIVPLDPNVPCNPETILMIRQGMYFSACVISIMMAYCSWTNSKMFVNSAVSLNIPSHVARAIRNPGSLKETKEAILLIMLTMFASDIAFKNVLPMATFAASLTYWFVHNKEALSKALDKITSDLSANLSAKYKDCSKSLHLKYQDCANILSTQSQKTSDSLKEFSKATCSVLKPQITFATSIRSKVLSTLPSANSIYTSDIDIYAIYAATLFSLCYIGCIIYLAHAESREVLALPASTTSLELKALPMCPVKYENCSRPA